MVYRLEVDISFGAEQDMVDFLNLLENYKAKASKEERIEPKIHLIRKCRYHKCFHDETPPKPCKDYKYIDFDKEVETHDTGELDIEK